MPAHAKMMVEQEVTCVVRKRPMAEARPVVVIQPHENSCISSDKLL